MCSEAKRRISVTIPLAILLYFQPASLTGIRHEPPCEWVIIIADSANHHSVEDKLNAANESDPSMTLSHRSASDTAAGNITSLENVKVIDFATAQRYLRPIPEEELANVSGINHRDRDLLAFGLEVLLKVNCSGEDGLHMQERLVRRLVSQRHLPQVTYHGISESSGPTELLLQALPVRQPENLAFAAPLTPLAAEMHVWVEGTMYIRAGSRHLSLGQRGSHRPPHHALDLACLSSRARTAMPAALGAALSRVQRVWVAPPISSDAWPQGLVPHAIRAGYSHIVYMVLTEFIEREQQQPTTTDHLVSPLQRYKERARLVDRAARYFYVTRNISVYVSPESFQKLKLPPGVGISARGVPPILYLDHLDKIEFGFLAPSNASIELVTDHPHMLHTRIHSCQQLTKQWRSCEALVRPKPEVQLPQHEPGHNLSWAEIRLKTTSARCSQNPPQPALIAIGCPASRTLMFNFTATFKKSGLGEKCHQCRCNRGVPCLLYTDVFRPELSLVDWTTYQYQPYTGPYTLHILGEGTELKTVRRYGAEERQRMNTLKWRIWAPSLRDEDEVLDDSELEQPVFRNVPESKLNGIKWHCDQYKNCPPFLIIELSNLGLNATTFCHYRVELVLFLYGVPTNTFVDVITMSAVFVVTLIVSLIYTCKLVWSNRARKVGSDSGAIKVVFPARDPDDEAS